MKKRVFYGNANDAELARDHGYCVDNTADLEQVTPLPGAIPARQHLRKQRMRSSPKIFFIRYG